MGWEEGGLLEGVQSQSFTYSPSQALFGSGRHCGEMFSVVVCLMYFFLRLYNLFFFGYYFIVAFHQTNYFVGTLRQDYILP